ncbi:MAG TPA: sigma-70 family RNA polymerase sigma factor [Tepidisphaeraceae bacterium]
MAKFRLDSIGALARQMAFTPHDALALQLTSAEQLLAEIDPLKAYPLEFVIFRITGYSPKKMSGDLLTGLALQHDLGLLIEQVSNSLGQLSSSLDEPVLAIDDLTARLGVTSKTIQRWRRRGLPARRFVFPDGKRRVGFVLSSVERFLTRQRDPLESANTSAIDRSEVDAMLRHARRLVKRCRCSRDEVFRRIARKLDRSPMTVLHTIRKFDLEHPDEAILASAAPVPTDEQRAVIARAARRRHSLRMLSRELNVSRGDVYRVVLAERVLKLSKRKVKFIDDPLYHQADAEDVVDSIANNERIIAETPAGDELRLPADLPSPLATLCRAALLSPARERALFLKLNFHKMKFVTARRRLDPELATHRDLAKLESHLRKASETKNKIIRANLRLVASIARRHLRGRLSLMELVSEGTMTLMRAVDSFDFHRGNKFSTYATLALMKGFARAVPQMLASRGGATAEAALDEVADRHSTAAADRFLVREQVTDLLRHLDSRERDVLREHYGLGDRSPATYEQLAERLGLTKQRVRQIEQAALAKLRASAG